MTLFNVFSLLGGLALFLFGMDIMGKALEKQAGGHLQKILSKLTDNPLKGFFLGLCVTAIIQSSSATTVMVVGFVNSGIMELHQAIGIIMGSNVGTTVTSWLLSLSGLQGDSIWIQMLKPTSFSPILAFIGILLYMGKNEKKKGIGTILIGFAILMTGMTTMSNAVEPLQGEAWFTNLFVRFSNPILGVLVGRPDFTNLFVVLKDAPNYTGPQTYEGLVKAGATVFGYGAFLTAIVQFLLLAFAVFWLIKIVVTARTRIAAEADRLLNAKHKEEEEAKAAAQAAAPAPAPAPAPSAEELELLREIRDLLKAQKGTAVKDE